ncbi:sugar phosphate isomerase/epimerase [Halobacillus sp. A5]|uniref:sugar phosphate isomerase/epimerase family protein n=1 Tax=Halobacillus sp. A5 TaxID=2880263 RepID=UPI0020A67D07|nr:sugar phosphate isomerase/epimerase [Halobacillus sp. A5]MCP3027794.1 sugar phosphate isomerase/epimerase [Halobacillus sp. A5]
MKFSVFTVMTPDLKPKELLTSLKDLGYDGVEWRYHPIPDEVKNKNPSYWGNNLATITPGSTSEQLEELKAWTTENGLETFSVTPYLKCGDIEGTERVLQNAQKLGADVIRLGVPPYDRTSNYHDLYNQALRYLSECEPLCRQYGVKGLVETHHETIAPSASLAYRLVSSFNSDHIGVLYDPGNMVIEGHENYRMGMELLGPYLAHVHAKNAVWQPERNGSGGETVSWETRWSPVPEGIVNWKEVLKDLKAVGYDGYIGMEDFCGNYETREALKFNLEYFRRMVYQL